MTVDVEIGCNTKNKYDTYYRYYIYMILYDQWSYVKI